MHVYVPAFEFCFRTVCDERTISDRFGVQGTHNDALDDLFQFLRPLELDVTAKRAKSKKAEVRTVMPSFLSPLSKILSFSNAFLCCLLFSCFLSLTLLVVHEIFVF